MTHNSDVWSAVRAAGPRHRRRRQCPAGRGGRTLEWQDAVKKRQGRRRAAWIAVSCLTSAALIALALHGHVGQSGPQTPVSVAGPRVRAHESAPRSHGGVLPRRTTRIGRPIVACRAMCSRAIRGRRDERAGTRSVGAEPPRGVLAGNAPASRRSRSAISAACTATSENRWVLGGRFVEMTLRAGTSGTAWSAVFYIGYERSERRHVLVSLEPGDRRITTRLGGWTARAESPRAEEPALARGLRHDDRWSAEARA